jgi:hypothetical protein
MRRKGKQGPVDGTPPLPLTTNEYLSLVDWTGRALRTGKRGAIPKELKPILKRLDLDTKQWLDTVERYGSLFWRVVGRAEAMLDAARRMGRHWFRGVGACRKFLTPAHSPP